MKSIDINRWPFFSQLSAEDQQAIMQNSTIKTLSIDNPLTKRHTCESSALFIVLKGTLEVFQMHETGKRVRLYTVEENEACLANVSAVLNHESYPVRTRAQAITTILHIDQNVARRVLFQNENFMGSLLKNSLDKMRILASNNLNARFVSLSDRVMDFLLEEARAKKTKTLYITHQDIADALGSSREVVSRTLKTFEKEDKLVLMRGKIKLTAL